MKSKLVILAVVLALLTIVLLRVSDSKASTADMPDTEVASNETQDEGLPSATATITITWRTAPNE